MLPYFPFERAPFALTMGVRPLGRLPLLEVDAGAFAAEVAERSRLLDEDRRYYCQALPGTEALQWEAVTEVLTALARDWPQHFALCVEGPVWHFVHRLLGTEWRFRPGDADSLPEPPLVWLGRQVQEDLLVMEGQAEGTPLVAGVLCFGSGWCLDDKLGRDMAAVHATVPGFQRTLGHSTQKLMERLKEALPIWRLNWGLAVTDALDLAPRTEPSWRPRLAGITAQNAGERVYLRLERQTLLRLPRTRGLLFGLHVYRAPVAGEVEDAERRACLRATLASLPPETAAYKRITPFLPQLLAWLEEREAREARRGVQG